VRKSTQTTKETPMTPDETRTLLGQIAAIDNRKMTPVTVRTWHTALQRHTHTD
jgi:hypothetical protein